MRSSSFSHHSTFNQKMQLVYLTWLSTSPIPTCEASQPTSNSSSEYGNANIGSLVTIFFKKLKLSLASLVEMNVFPLVQFVMGATIQLNF
jgi:hypothetical protein